MSIRLKSVAAAAVLILFALALARAATHRYQEREDAFRKECQLQMQKLGLTPADAKLKYPTPEIQLASSACVTPGGTADLVVNGKFSPGSKFFVENDNIDIVKESLAGNQYRATLQAAAGIGPETAAVAVISPRGQMVRQDRAVKVGGLHEWTLQAANGWKVVARPQRTSPCPPASGDDAYEVSFFRLGEAAAFEKLTGTLNFSLWDSQNFRFSLSAPAAAMGGMAAYQELMQKMSDPKLTDAQREELVKKLEAASQQMQAAMNPEAIKQQAAEQQRRQQEFGCDAIALTTGAGGKVTGEMRCAEKVGRRLAVTGTMALMK
jgi:hypothetical protein